MSDIPRYITTSQLEVIRSVLSEGGYSDEVWATSPPNSEAQALVRLVQDGMSDPIDLARELEARFGNENGPSAALLRSLDQLADHGMRVAPGLDSPTSLARTSKFVVDDL